MRTTFHFPDQLIIEKVVRVKNTDICHDFNSHYNKITVRQKDNPDLFKKRAWMLRADSDRKLEVMERCEEYTNIWKWNEKDKLPIIPLLHGTDLKVANAICTTGFTTIASLDCGFYGQGMYFSSHGAYITPYFASKGDPCILLCYAVLGNVYPVTECPIKNSDELLGKPVKSGYHSHYANTNRKGMIYDPNVDTECFDEFVLFQESQVIPAYVITFGKKNLAKLLRIWNRDNIQG